MPCARQSKCCAGAGATGLGGRAAGGHGQAVGIQDHHQLAGLVGDEGAGERLGQGGLAARGGRHRHRELAGGLALGDDPQLGDQAGGRDREAARGGAAAGGAHVDLHVVQLSGHRQVALHLHQHQRAVDALTAAAADERQQQGQQPRRHQFFTRTQSRSPMQSPTEVDEPPLKATVVITAPAATAAAAVQNHQRV